jgi:hypothetical protein
MAIKPRVDQVTGSIRREEGVRGSSFQLDEHDVDAWCHSRRSKPLRMSDRVADRRW